MRLAGIYSSKFPVKCWENLVPDISHVVCRYRRRRQVFNLRYFWQISCPLIHHYGCR